MRIFVTTITVSLFVHWTTVDMQFNKHAVVLLHGRERWGMPFTHFFPGRMRFPLFLMLPFSFNRPTNFDGITVLKQSANHATILAKIFSYAPRKVSLTSYKHSPLLV